jgi:hypothetical protein
VLGFDKSIYFPKKVMIDQKLLKNRNNIAHGQHLDIDEGEYYELYYEILEIIELFRNELENAAALNAYKRPTATPNPT